MRPTIFILAFLINVLPYAVYARWQPDGVALSTAGSDQGSQRIVSDGAGGAIVVWSDFRSGNRDVYAQRVDASGAPQWIADGVAICTAANHQFFPAIVSDGAGGAIVTWYDRRGADDDIYAQRVNAFGVPQWTIDGVAVCNAAGNQSAPEIVSDGAGGAIITWYDYRNGTNADIYVRQVNASGVPQWNAFGVALCTAAANQFNPTIVSDGDGGAIVTWFDERNGIDDNIYAQRVNASGVPLWTFDGVALCVAVDQQFDPSIASDGSGGAIVAWYDYRSGTSFDIYARRVNASGVPQWTADGVALCTAPSDQTEAKVTSNGAGGAIITWVDPRDGNLDIYAQQVNLSGVLQWTFDGVALGTAAGDEFGQTIATNENGEAIITWYDATISDIYVQRLNASGVPQWNADGVAPSTGLGSKYGPAIVSDGVGGTIVAWSENRAGHLDIYAQRVEARYGYWGYPEPAITSVADVPGDQGGTVKVNWTASDSDVLNLQTITHYSVWRATDPIAAANAIAINPSLLVSETDVTAQFTGPAFRVERGPTTDYYWELVGTQSAQYFEGYRFSAPTSADSTSQGTATHYFQVLSHTANPFTFWPSNALGGHSVDNLAPATPLTLTAQRAGAEIQLRWNGVEASDLHRYAVYRATSSGVTPVSINFLASSDDTILVDTNLPTSALYYIVTAYDVHENQSGPSNEVSVGAPTNIGNTPPPITALTVLDNVPNPFADATTLRVGLPRASEVEIEVFDVAGRRVRRERTAAPSAGWQEFAIDARDSRGRLLPSGVYFYRVKAAGVTLTRKMVIAR